MKAVLLLLGRVFVDIGSFESFILDSASWESFAGDYIHHRYKAVCGVLWIRMHGNTFGFHTCKPEVVPLLLAVLAALEG